MPAKGKGKGMPAPPPPQPKATAQPKVWAKVVPVLRKGVDVVNPCQTGPAVALPMETSVPSYADARKTLLLCLLKRRGLSEEPRTVLPEDPYGMGRWGFLPRPDEGVANSFALMPVRERLSRLNLLLKEAKRGDCEAIDIAVTCAQYGGLSTEYLAARRCRLLAIRLLLRVLSQREAVLTAVACFDHRDLRKEAVAALAGMWQEDSVGVAEAFMESLKESSSEKQAQPALQAIAVVGTTHEGLTALIRPLAEDPRQHGGSLGALALSALARVAPPGDEAICRAAAGALGATFEGDVSVQNLWAAADAVSHLAEAGNPQAIDAAFGCLSDLASGKHGDDKSPLASCLGGRFDDHNALRVVERLLQALPADDERLAPLLGALLQGLHRSWAVVRCAAEAAVAKLPRGCGGGIAAVLCNLLKAYSSPQLVLGRKAIRFPFEYTESWDTECTMALNQKLQEAGLKLEDVPQEGVVITDVYGYVLQDSSVRPSIRPGRERFPISVVYNGMAPVGSRGYCVRACPERFSDLNGMYLQVKGSTFFQQYLGLGVLMHLRNGWQLQSAREECTIVVARAVGLPSLGFPSGEAPGGHWRVQGSEAETVEVVPIDGQRRHALGNLDPLVLRSVLVALAAHGMEGDEEGIDAACIIQTTNLLFYSSVEQALSTLATFAPVGNAKALESACTCASHLDAGVREAALELILKIARPEDLGLIKENLVHVRGQHARILKELDRKFSEVECAPP